MTKPHPKEFIEKLTKSKNYVGQLRHVEILPARAPQYGNIPASLDPRLISYLQDNNIRLWTHQATALETSLHGEHVAIVTPTASGKSLCYQLAVINAILKDPSATTLLIFPRKALAQDQFKKISQLLEGIGLDPHIAGIYDGDTPAGEKRRIRDECNIVLTNPHGLNLYIHPTLWYRFYSHLRFIILDESHMYRGVFGSNFAFVLRRLLRIIDRHKLHPQFIASSATISNPTDHLFNLTGQPFTVIEKDGSAGGEKHLLFWDLPVYELPEKGPEAPENTRGGASIRKSAHVEAFHLFVKHLKAHYQTLMFTTSRKMTEVQAHRAIEYFQKKGTLLAGRIKPYRAGYTASDRRSIEEDLRDGRLAGVVSTNALELGIDIGSLDAIIISGFPGTITSFWQQAGRSGRTDQPALATFVPFENPLDMHYLNHPEDILHKPTEAAIISTRNEYILLKHLAAAAQEAPLLAGEDKYFGSTWETYAQRLVNLNVLKKTGARYVYVGSEFPQGKVQMEVIGERSYKVLVRQPNGYTKLLTEESEDRVFSELHEGAIYLYMTEQFLVTEWDREKLEVYLQPVQVDYYTEALRVTDIKVLGVEREQDHGTIHAYFGIVQVTHKYIGYRQVEIRSGERLDFYPLDLPPSTFETRAVWFTVRGDIEAYLLGEGYDLGGIVHAIEHTAIAMTPKFASCDRQDIGGVSLDADPIYRLPTIYIYDGYPGGIGLAEQDFAVLLDLLRVTLDRLETCLCASGCPACCYSPKCGNNNSPLDKSGAIACLKKLL